MLPEIQFTAVDSMQDVASDDFDLLNGLNSIYEKGMCLAVHRVPPNASPIVPLDQQQKTSTENDTNSYIGTVAPTTHLLNGIKIEDASPTDLFPTHPTTWQQHPMNSHEHAHHRLQNHQHNKHRNHNRHQNRLNSFTSKLLLQNSDDPLICRGANSVVTADDDQPLIIAISQNAGNHQNNQIKGIQGNNSMSVSSTASLQILSSGATFSQLPKKVPQNGCSSLTKQQLKVKANLMSAQNRAAIELKKSSQQTGSVAGVMHYKADDTKLSKKKGVLKLRFHHQALPPEYLSHYEATQGQFSQHVKDSKLKPAELHPKIKVFHPSKLPPAKSTHENVRSWLQKIAAIHRSAQQSDSKPREEIVDQEQKNLKPPTVKALNDTNNNYQVSRIQTTNESVMKNGLQALARHTYNSEKSEPIKSSSDNIVPNPMVQQVPSALVLPNKTATGAVNSAAIKKVMNYADLPYMGEMTLDHSKPRRGRKPKKADICHLIYKNYGTIFPGTPKNALTAQNATLEMDEGQLSSRISNDLPLNLCLRDQPCDHLSISSEESENIICPLSSNSTSKVEIEEMNSSNIGLETILDSKFNHVKIEPDEKNGNSTHITSSLSNKNSPKAAELNSNNVLLHPVNLYYQKLLSGTLVNEHSQPFGLPVETIEKDNQLTLKIPIPNGLLRTPKSEKVSPLPNVDSQANDYPDLISTPSSIKSDNSNMTTNTSVSATTTTTTRTPTHQQITPQKRKRSAIFIPPIPAENTTNPATEVSICKFKFTGGAKPSLQEKKMLSVDSGGNYRYYSGTGDKSTRGYEFFPRESLQNSAGFLPGVNCAATFPNTANECLTSDIPPPSAELSNEILQIPESPTGTLLLPGSVALQEPSSPSPLSRSTPSFSGSPALLTQQLTQNPETILSLNSKNDMSTRRPSTTIILARDQFSNDVYTSRNSYNSLQSKKKSRRSSQREKLEKTFKERGFLIQTQQLESAEGATYCKFRQLKKFTRYLFRNWKDYLPEEVHQANTAEQVVVLHPPNTESDVKKEVDAVDNFTEQLAVESLLERHGFLVTSGECPQNSGRPSTASSMMENILPEQHSADNTA
ncbi:uncharacterized protein LOC129243022 isoform X1 [Anastrepha obliqua]|uniref:uncharacterized protein LOC129243022 isoform X1 n=2 Tax=Anastrepha obliqua TaxID=95512 RepID=UPI00240A1C94|nr:uncharacterized protein LOC129243022 isoform X1 [Anastrepha obliqua]XP_054736023.1 uncharacterized protein LOC129243022 isoform X1 [Anastrepha obliqua]